jgi:hypothetical protein
LLAISMLDGTFVNEQVGSSDGIKEGSDKDYERGAHRAAAKRLLIK